MRFQADITLNLHHLTAEAALWTLRRKLESGNIQGKTVLVIHGYGKGRLRETVRNWASHSPLVKKVWEGEEYFLDGGGGVTALFF